MDDVVRITEFVSACRPDDLADLKYLLGDASFGDAIAKSTLRNVVVDADKYRDSLNCNKKEGAMKAAKGLIADDMLRSHARGRPLDSNKNAILDPSRPTSQSTPSRAGGPSSCGPSTRPCGARGATLRSAGAS
jgi:hypothetical protein